MKSVIIFIVINIFLLEQDSSYFQIDKYCNENYNRCPIQIEFLRFYEESEKFVYSVNMKPKENLIFILNKQFKILDVIHPYDYKQYYNDEGVDSRFFSSLKEELYANEKGWELYIIEDKSIQIITNGNCFHFKKKVNFLNCISSDINWGNYNEITICEDDAMEICFEEGNTF